MTFLAQVNLLELKKSTVVITPVSLRSGLDFQDLETLLETNLVLLKASEGSINFINGVFNPSCKAGRLILEADKDVYISSNPNSVCSLNIEVVARNDVYISGSGLNTKGGNFKCLADKIFIKEAGLKTGSGEVELCAFSLVEVTGSGLNTNGGDLSTEGRMLRVNMDGIQIGYGNIHLNMQDRCDISGRGISCKAASISSSDFILSGDGLLAQQDVSLSCSGEIAVLKGGIQINGGNFYCRGQSITIGGDTSAGGSGILTNGGNVHIKTEKDILIRARGIYSGTGDIVIFSIDDIYVSRGGVTTTNGNISVTSARGIIVLDGMNLNTNIGPKIGEGRLDTSNIIPDRLILHTEPVLGGGNITITTLGKK